MFNLDISDLNFENVGSWPIPIKVTSITLVALLIISAAYWFDTRSQTQNLKYAHQRELKLRKELEDKQQVAVNLQAYKDQLVKIGKRFGKMLLQLPSKTEVPGLLEDISKTGIASGLEFKLFDPMEEIQHDFYAELPIRISVIGNYHQLGAFVSQVAELDRIVTLHDFDIMASDGKKQMIRANGKLLMNITAKIYRYTETQDATRPNNTNKKEKG